VATDMAAKRGVLFKQAVSLEQASKIEAIIFDKTGTLTEGKPRVTDVVADGIAEAELLRLAGAAEARSGHPLAQAVLDELERRGLANDASVGEFENIPGHGVRATVGGRQVLVGAPRLLERFSVALGPLADTADQLIGAGKTVILVAVDGRPAGVIAAADVVRPNAAQAIADLKTLGIYEKSAVVVVSDHGDQFYEHGSVGHGDTVYQELVHVPLMIRAPGVFPAGKVVHADVEVMDLYATLIDLAGIKPTAAAEGTSLAPLAHDEVGSTPRAALTVDGQVSRGLKVQRYRMVHRGPGRIELYDEFDDPREQKDIAAERPIALRGMRGVLGLLYAYETTWSKARWGTAANVNEAFYAAAGPPGRRGAEPVSSGPK